MNQVRLFAWTVPAFFKNSVVDHTWVTTYDNRVTPYASIVDVVKAKEHYWYCWGDFHPKGGTPSNATGYLTSAKADFSYAACLCQPDADSRTTQAARGTIFRYGIDGVCHQLANQILWATDPTGVSPQTVWNARGYWISHGLFGPYGTQHAAWKAKLAVCHPSGGAEMNATSASSIDDGFKKHLQEVLRGRDSADEKIQQLLDRRVAFMGQMETLRNSPTFSAGGPSVDDLNRLYSSFLREAARILGNEDFERVFDQPPSDEMNVVDPTIYESTVVQSTNH